MLPLGIFPPPGKYCSYLFQNIHPYMYLCQVEPFILLLSSEFHGHKQLLCNTPVAWHCPASLSTSLLHISITICLGFDMQVQSSWTTGKQGQVPRSSLHRKGAHLTAVGAVNGEWNERGWLKLAFLKLLQLPGTVLLQERVTFVTVRDHRPAFMPLLTIRTISLFKH